jgi:hypothetical protein
VSIGPGAVRLNLHTVYHHYNVGHPGLYMPEWFYAVRLFVYWLAK